MQTNDKQAALAKILGAKAAKQIATQFTDIGAAIDQGADVAPAVAEKLAAVRTLLYALTDSQLRRRDCLSSYAQVIEYLRARIARVTRERCHVLYLDRKNRLIKDDVTEGTVDHVPVYPREIARKALLLDASSVILAHNHPSGDPTPSTADIEMTQQVVAALKAWEIPVHDHFIIGSERTTSLRQLGLM